MMSSGKIKLTQRELNSRNKQISHYFKTTEREPYSYICTSQAPSAGKYKPKFTQIEKDPFIYEIKEEMDKSFVKQ